MKGFGNFIDRRRMLNAMAGATAGAFSPRMMAATDRNSCPEQPTAWVEHELQKMLAVTPGMSRLELLRVFTTEGGMSTAFQRPFVSAACMYFKVNVTFRRSPQHSSTAEKSDSVTEYKDDEIITISPPYLAFAIFD